MCIHFIGEADFKQGSIILINKNKGEYSFTALKKIRHLIKKHTGIEKFKIGHAGTLDPLATGLLVFCTGKATKMISELQNTFKEYIAEIKLGETTSSLDAETDIDKTFRTDHINLEMVKHAIKHFTGNIIQTPPEYSALKINGERAYKKARRGESIKMKQRKVIIREIELLDFNAPLIRIRVVCSKGTYIRSLARDFGTYLKSGAYLSGLTRTKSGNFSVEHAVSTQDFEEKLIKIIPSLQ